jgi:hypothetical protein
MEGPVRKLEVLCSKKMPDTVFFKSPLDINKCFCLYLEVALKCTKTMINMAYTGKYNYRAVPDDAELICYITEEGLVPL